MSPYQQRCMTPPSMSKSLDVTAFISSNRTKRKRSLGKITALKPILRGSLIISNDKIIWSGCWGLSFNSFSTKFDNKVVKAPFYFERTRLVSEIGKDQSLETSIMNDGYFSGYFCMQDLANKSAQRSTVSFVKHFENDIMLRFVKTLTPSLFEVVGSGENKFGKFLIEGIFNVATGEINCARNYLPKNIQRKSLRSEKPSRLPSPTPRRSSRERIPSIKYRESYAVGLDKKKKPKQFDFPGRAEVLKIAEDLAIKKPELGKARILTEFIEELRDSRVRSLKIAAKQLTFILRKLEPDSATRELTRDLQEVNEKFGVIKTPLSVEVHDLSKSGKYTSLFENLSILQEIDPLSLNPAADLPTRVKFPGLFDLAGCVEKPGITFADESPDPQSGSNCEITDDLAVLCPMNDVDFSDLSYLDAETLKQLNEFVDFSCPSKGA